MRFISFLYSSFSMILSFELSVIHLLHQNCWKFVLKYQRFMVHRFNIIKNRVIILSNPFLYVSIADSSCWLLDFRSFQQFLLLFFPSFHSCKHSMMQIRNQYHPMETGKKVGEYLFQYSQLIGKGNFARVYKGTHLPTGQIVAIKAVSLDALKSKRLQALVFEEIRILQMMDHPNILRLREALLSDRNCYIVTELCPDGNLEEKIKKGLMENSQIAALTLQLIEGLTYLRSMGVVHRDFKTANIFLSSGVAKIADFGLAKIYTERFHDIDIGSPHYMSPQGLLMNVYGEKTDIWALGVILYEMIHGRTPFAHCQLEKDLRYCIVRPLGEASFKKDIHPVFKQLIVKMMEVDQNRRPSIGDVIRDPLVEALREMVRSVDQNNKRKFSFHEKYSSQDVFHKKEVKEWNNINLQSALHLPIQNPNKSFSVPNTFRKPQQQQQQQTQQTQSCFKGQTLNMPKFTFGVQCDTQMQAPSRPLSYNGSFFGLQMSQNGRFWGGESSKTNQTKDSEEDEFKYKRINKQRNFGI